LLWLEPAVKVFEPIADCLRIVIREAERGIYEVNLL